MAMPVEDVEGWNRGFYCGVIGTAISPSEGEATVTQPGWLRWQLLVVTALALATACTSPRGLEPSPSLTGNPAPGLLSGTCPVTRSVPPDRVPERVKRVIRAGSSEPTKVTFNDWYGNDVLWVALPPGAKIVKPPGEELSEKFPWVRLIHGHLTIEGRRLDDASGPARLSVPSGGVGSGFQASGIAFPTEGCWEVTGKIARQELSFVVKVRRGQG
jgi:hypothetical protein